MFISGYSKCIGYIVATTVEHIKYSRVKGFGTGGYACIYDGKTCAILTHGGKPFKNVRAIIADKKGIFGSYEDFECFRKTFSS